MRANGSGAAYFLIFLVGKFPKLMDRPGNPVWFPEFSVHLFPCQCARFAGPVTFFHQPLPNSYAITAILVT